MSSPQPHLVVTSVSRLLWRGWPKRWILLGLRFVLAVCARDATRATSTKTCLVLAPHPDDETLGCATAIMRKQEAGKRVVVAIATDGAMFPEDRPRAQVALQRELEFESARAMLGLEREDVTWFGFPDGLLVNHIEPLNEKITDLLRKFHPDEVLVTGASDPHEDHAALSRAAIHAALTVPCRVVEYPIWQWERPSTWKRLPRVRPEIVRAGQFRKRKLRVLLCYRSQLSVADGGERVGNGLPSGILTAARGRFEVYFPVPAATTQGLKSARRRGRRK